MVLDFIRRLLSVFGSQSGEAQLQRVVSLVYNFQKSVYEILGLVGESNVQFLPRSSESIYTELDVEEEEGYRMTDDEDIPEKQR